VGLFLCLEKKKIKTAIINSNRGKKDSGVAINIPCEILVWSDALVHIAISGPPQ
jgi:hypothetical protein